MSTKTPPANSPLILTLDIGTSSSRAMLFDSQARPVPGMMAQIPYQLQTTAAGDAYFDPAALLDRVVNTIDQLLQQAGPLAKQIGGVAVDTFVTNIVGIDKTGRPITPHYTYAGTRSAADAEALRRELDLAAVHNHTGCRIHSAYLPPLFRWLARTQPEVFKSVKYWMSIGEYLLYPLFGERRASYSMASWTGLLNRHSLSWDEEWLDYLSVAKEQLSPLVDVDRPMQGLQAPWAARWPALKDVPWFPAIGDGAAANIGSGCTGPERLALTIGTPGAMRVAFHQPIKTVPEGLWVYRINRAYALLGGATTEGGSLFAWCRQTLQLPAHVEADLAHMPPAGHGLTVLPCLGGDRAPDWLETARSTLHGLAFNTRPIDIFQAGLESMAYRFALSHRLIVPPLPPEHQVIASGAGLLNSPAWMQMVADVLGRPLLASAEKEATSRGAAALALDALGISGNRPAAIAATFQPNPAHHARYQAALEAHVELYQKLVA